jgi:hypothetical protein
MKGKSCVKWRGEKEGITLLECPYASPARPSGSTKVNAENGRHGWRHFDSLINLR